MEVIIKKRFAHVFNTSISLALAGILNANSMCMGMLSMLAPHECCNCVTAYHKHVQLSALLHNRS